MLVVDLEDRVVRFAGAAQPPVLHFFGNSKRIESLISEMTFLGFQDPLPVSCSTEQKSVNSGDKIVLYSDGLIDTENTNGEASGADSLEEFTMTNGDLDGVTFNRKLIEAVMEYSGGVLVDYILLLTVTIK